jgi:hypothetical protein
MTILVTAMVAVCTLPHVPICSPRRQGSADFLQKRCYFSPYRSLFQK